MAPPDIRQHIRQRAHELPLSDTLPAEELTNVLKNDVEGVKLEEQVLITDSGCVQLSTFPYEENLLSREL